VLVEIGEDIVELAEGALRLDLGTEPRPAGAGIALKGGDRGLTMRTRAGGARVKLSPCVPLAVSGDREFGNAPPKLGLRYVRT